MKLCSLLFLLLPLTALADGERIPYTCDNASHIDIAFSTAADGRPQAIVYFADTRLSLPQVIAASGAAYKQDGIALYTKDEAAVFEDGKGNVRRCTQGDSAPTQATTSPVASSFININGSLSYPIDPALPDNAVLLLRIKETTGRGTAAHTLAEQSIPLAGQTVPIAFQMLVDRDLLRKKGQLSISARIEGAGKLLFINDKTYPLLNNGQPDHIDVQLKKAPLPRKKP